MVNDPTKHHAKLNTELFENKKCSENIKIIYRICKPHGI